MARLEIQNLETGYDQIDSEISINIGNLFPLIELIMAGPRWRAIAHVSPSEIISLLDRFGLEIRGKEIRLDKI